MNFIIDKQTLNDLKIFDKGKGNSIYGLYNVTRTRGGSLILEDMFKCPLAEVNKINARSSIIKYFMEQRIGFNFENEWFDSIEHYLRNNDVRAKISSSDNTIGRKIKGYVGGDIEYEQVHKGVISTISILNAVDDIIKKIDIDKIEVYREDYLKLKALLSEPTLAWAMSERGVKKLSYEKSAQYDELLRYQSNEKLKDILYYIYNMDVYISIAEVAKRNGYVFASALPQGENVLKLRGIYHPLLKEAKPNDIDVDKSQNVIFLTGANMAGKSTFMKTFGVIIFLAHMGFPLPAKSVEFTVQNGLFTTINLPDNLNMGYSHFYSEVLRLKRVALQVSHGEHLIIIFDELFRGTNVKDAHEATVAVTKAFAKRQNSTFMISTHIIEAGEDLSRCCNNINFVYLPTITRGSEATYTYQLAQGITGDRHGMMIINNEGIIDILKKRSNGNQ